MNPCSCFCQGTDGTRGLSSRLFSSDPTQAPKATDWLACADFESDDSDWPSSLQARIAGSRSFGLLEELSCDPSFGGELVSVSASVYVTQSKAVFNEASSRCAGSKIT